MKHFYSFTFFIFSFLLIACAQQNDARDVFLSKRGYSGAQVSIDEAESELIASLEVLYP